MQGDCKELESPDILFRFQKFSGRLGFPIFFSLLLLLLPAAYNASLCHPLSAVI